MYKPSQHLEVILAHLKKYKMHRQNTYRFSPPKPIEDYSKDSVKKIAVLFTDIVGSSRYFKERGDIAGRKMLRVHQDLASPIISSFGGTVVKMIGDSVLAYFLNPDEALKAAIKLQQKFQSHNNGKMEKDQIHIRICVHYGDGILDEGDIFGDVVNMAAKFLPHAQGDQILISKQLHSNLKDPSLTSFENFEFNDCNNILNGMKLFKVAWDQILRLDPTTKTLIHFKPAWGLCRNDFPGIWNRMINLSHTLFPENLIDKMQVDQDRSVNVIVKENSMAIAIAKKALDYLRKNMGHDGMLYVPVQIVIDSGPYLVGDQISSTGLLVSWQDIEPGDIHISNRIAGLTDMDTKSGESGLIPVGAGNRFFKLTDNISNNTDNFLAFKYQNALIQGENNPCFYCGSRQHTTSGCPSKMITELTRFTEKIGYKSLPEINNMFFNYLHTIRLNNNTTDISGNINTKGPAQIAHNAFYELKGVFQLRLLRAVWSLRGDSWNMIWDTGEDNEKGGILWIGLDCIRVSNFDQAESIIRNELLNNNSDYRLLILAALLFIENNNLQHALSYLKKALEEAKRTPQKIYILFLLSRTYYLSDDPVKAREMLRRILRLSPYCTEATYQEIIFKLQHGNRSLALDQLVKLIKKNKDYYVISLIDPELAPYSNKIYPRLEKLLVEAKEKANSLIPELKKEVESQEKVMGKDTKEIREARTTLNRIDELLKTDSYFGYLDIIHFGENINRLGQKIIEEREKALFKKQKAVRQRILSCHNYLDLLPYPFLAASVTQQLKVVEAKFNTTSEKIKLEGIGEYKLLLNELDIYLSEIDLIEIKIKRVDTLEQFMAFAASFLKKNVIFQSINLILSLILLPIMIHYLSFLWPDLNLSAEGIWHYQKILIMLGGISGIILATIASQNSTIK